MNDFLIKPFDPHTLFSTLLRSLNDRNANRSSNPIDAVTR